MIETFFLVIYFLLIYLKKCFIILQNSFFSFISSNRYEKHINEAIHENHPSNFLDNLSSIKCILKPYWHLIFSN